jgi:hypothetical protein
MTDCQIPKKTNEKKSKIKIMVASTLVAGAALLFAINGNKETELPIKNSSWLDDLKNIRLEQKVQSLDERFDKRGGYDYGCSLSVVEKAEPELINKYNSKLFCFHINSLLEEKIDPEIANKYVDKDCYLTGWEISMFAKAKVPLEEVKKYKKSKITHADDIVKLYEKKISPEIANQYDSHWAKDVILAYESGIPPTKANKYLKIINKYDFLEPSMENIILYAKANFTEKDVLLYHGAELRKSDIGKIGDETEKKIEYALRKLPLCKSSHSEQKKLLFAPAPFIIRGGAVK